MSGADDLMHVVEREAGRAESSFESFRSRALAVLSVSTGSATVLSGSLAVGANSATFRVPRGAVWFAIGAVALLVLSMVLAIAVHWPLAIVAVDAASLSAKPIDASLDWLSAGLEHELAYVASLQKASRKMEVLFAWSLAVQLAAVGAVGGLVWQLLPVVTK